MTNKCTGTLILHSKIKDIYISSLGYHNRVQPSKGVTTRGVTFDWCGFCSILNFVEQAITLVSFNLRSVTTKLGKNHPFYVYQWV